MGNGEYYNLGNPDRPELRKKAWDNDWRSMLDSLPNLRTTRKQRRRAAEVLKDEATSVEEAAMFLSMLGLDKEYVVHRRTAA